MHGTAALIAIAIARLRIHAVHARLEYAVHAYLYTFATIYVANLFTYYLTCNLKTMHGLKRKVTYTVAI